MHPAETGLSTRGILAFWAPLAATWLMMAAEGPFLAALIARMADPTFNLAAYGVAFSFAVLVEAPIIMIMSASTALVKDRHSYLKLRNFTFTLNAGITGIMLMLLVPPVFSAVAGDLIGLPGEVSRLTYRACWALLPWPAAIGFRRFYQGILIRHGQTRRVAYGTAVRLASILLSSSLLFRFISPAGAVLGGVSLGFSVTAEALATRRMAHSAVRSLLHGETPASAVKPLTYPAITRFYYPLALTSLLGLGVQPLVTFFLGKSRMGLESLAVMPVVISLVFLFRALGLSYQEVAIALIGNEGRNLPELRRFAAMLAVAVSGGLSFIAYSPAALFWFQKVSGLSPQLTRFAVTPTRILAFIPALTVWISLQRGVLVEYQRTAHITIATSIEVVSIFCLLTLTIHGLDLIGATAAALSLIAGRSLANLYLVFPCTKVRKKQWLPLPR